MPVVEGVGQSGYSKIKEEHYAKLLGWHMGVAERVIRNDNRNSYLMIDATAGAGKLYNCDEVDGSPLVFLKQASQHPTAGRWRAVFCEENPEPFHKLYNNTFGAPNTILQAKPYQDVLRQYKQKWQIGLLYVDENGTPDFSALREFAKNNPRMEILISVTATGVKRGKKTEYHLHEWIEKIGKDYWLIRKPYGQWQWTFLLGSNLNVFGKEYKAIDMYPVDSEVGKQYMEKATYTESELTQINGQQTFSDFFS